MHQTMYLTALESHLLELKHVSKDISNHLDYQLAQLDQVTLKVERTADDMRAVTATVSRLAP
jgi:hypothetical protein